MDYDEGLMAGMARSGSGSHYFAHEESAIADAFSQEKFSADAMIVQSVSVRCAGVTEQFGHFWGGETKKRVFKVAELQDITASVRYTDRATGIMHTDNLTLPTEFGYSEDVRLENLTQLASEAEGEMLRVRDPRTAGQMKERLRAIVLSLLNHPASDEPMVASTIDRLKASIERLERLERNYLEEDATMHRKRSMQSSHNLREKAQAYSSFHEDRSFVRELFEDSFFAKLSAPVAFEAAALDLAPLDDWIRWKAVPIKVLADQMTVALEDPKRGFVLSEIEKAVGRRVKAVFAGISDSEIVELLKSASNR